MSEFHDFGPPKTSTPPPNYLVAAILTTLFCCLPFGIVSIVFGAQVSGKHAAGDYAGAMAASKNAKQWAWLSFWFGLVGLILIFALVGFFFYMGIQQAQQRGAFNADGRIRIQAPGGGVQVGPGGVNVQGPGGEVKVGPDGVNVDGPDGAAVKVGPGGVEVRGPGEEVKGEPDP